MPLTLKGNRTGRIIAIHSDVKDVYDSARDYLLAQHHKYNKLHDQVSRATYDWERQEIEQKASNLDDRVTAYDAFNRPVVKYWCRNDGVVEKMK